MEFIEKLIIKSILKDKNFLILVSSTFDKKYFDDINASNIFEFASKYQEKYNKIPPKDVIISNIEDKNIKEYFEEIEVIDFDIPKNYDYLFDETNKYLKDKSIKRAILDSVSIIESNDEIVKIENIIKDALCKDLKIDIGLDYFKTFRERLKRIFTASDTRVPSYFPVFDEYINGGFPPFTLSIAISKIHGGKSQLICNFAARQVLHGHNVVLLTLEMAEDAFAQRFDSVLTSLDINKIYTVTKHKKLLINKLKNINKQKGLGNLFIKQFPTGQASVIDFRKYIRELILRDIKPSIIYADYINLMKPSYKNRGDMYMDVKLISEELRALSFEFECPIISVTQLNREGSLISFDEVDFTHISESLGTVATSDTMIILGHNEHDMVYESEQHYKFVKNRLGGRVGEMNKFYVDIRSLKMYDSIELDLWLEDAKISGDDRNMKEIEDDKPKYGRRKK